MFLYKLFYRLIQLDNITKNYHFDMGKNSILREIDVKSRIFHIFTSQILKNTFDFGLWAQIQSILKN